jgi:hypothetical protein
LSASKSSWLDAHFECNDKNAKLAEPVKSADRTLRKFLIDHGKARGFIWLGGMYNWGNLKHKKTIDNLIVLISAVTFMTFSYQTMAMG